ncbi:MAG: hypothetical protein JRE23_17870 [Deltaproteobacteria bacterium]|nr:hypothetical protein [Deltaproteobacteria bacterium]
MRNKAAGHIQIIIAVQLMALIASGIQAQADGVIKKAAGIIMVRLVAKRTLIVHGTLLMIIAMKKAAGNLIIMNQDVMTQHHVIGD